MCTDDESLFSNLITFKTHLLHELILAFDWCRIDINFNDCDQLACSQIRASRMSGECNPNNINDVKNRFEDSSDIDGNDGNNITNRNDKKINFGFFSGKGNSGQGLRCIRKNAALNVDRMYSHCHSKNGSGKVAWQSVNNAWMQCFRDFDPFYDKQDAW